MINNYAFDDDMFLGKRFWDLTSEVILVLIIGMWVMQDKMGMGLGDGLGSVSEVEVPGGPEDEKGTCVSLWIPWDRGSSWIWLDRFVD